MAFAKGHKKIAGSGRKKGQLSRQTEEVRKLALAYGPDAIKQLAKLMTSAQDERAQVAACKEIADRAYGKSSQTLGIDPENNKITVHLIGDDAKL